MMMDEKDDGQGSQWTGLGRMNNGCMGSGQCQTEWMGDDGLDFLKDGLGGEKTWDTIEGMVTKWTEFDKRDSEDGDENG